MSVFISYNHNDSDFVDKLALELVRNNVKVWKDKWKINVGDSFINKIESGIEGASFLIIVLSKNSLQSKWVKKELNAALIREVNENKIKILPIMIDDCEIPLFLREKLYADFREDFEAGLNQIIGVVTKKYNLDGGGRVNDNTTYYFDYAIEHGFSGQRFFMDIDIVSFDTEERFSILTQLRFVSSEYPKNTILGESTQNDIKVTLLRTCGQEFSANPARKVITSGKTVHGNFNINDEKKQLHFDISFRVKRLGIVSGSSVVFNIGALLVQICDNLGIEYL